MRRILRSLLLVAVLASTAWVLSVTTGGFQLPHRPSLDEIRDGLSSSYLSIDAVLDVFGLIAWLLWIYIVSATLLRVLAAIATRLALPGADRLVWFSDRVTPLVLRRILDLVLGGALLVSAVGGPRAAAAHQQLNPPAAVQMIGVVSNGHKTNAEVEVRKAEPIRGTYSVRPGDSLWRISERELGSGLRWREIYDLNVRKEQPDGRKLREPRLIRPGWELLLPNVSSFEPESPTAEPESPTAEPPAAPAIAREIPETPSVSPNPTVQEDHDVIEEEPAPIVIQRPIKVELPDGVAVPASFAAGALAASAIERLRRRRLRRMGERVPPTSTDPVAQVAARVGIDPSVDVLGPQSDAVIRAWREATGKTPTFLAAWEETQSTSFLIAGSPERLPASFETATRQRIIFENLGKHTRAMISGPQVPRLRRSPYTAGDGVLVPLGFADSGVLHLPLLGSPLHVYGPSAALCIKAVLAFATLRLGENAVEVWSNDKSASMTDSGLREKLELEALLRRRLFAEEKVFGFIDHVLENPDDQLPVIIVVVDAEVDASISDLESILVNLGIAILIKGEGDSAVRKILCEADLTRLDVAGLEPMTLEPARVPERVTSLDHGFEGGTAPDLVDEIESHESWMAVGEDLAQDQAFIPEANDGDRHIAVETQQEAEVSRRVYCLGGLKIEVDGDVQQKGWRSPALEILAALIAYPKGLSRDQLVSMVWPDSEFSEVERLFYTSISQIRSNLRGPADASKIVLSSRVEDLYRLDLSQVWVDIAAFRREIDAARSSTAPEPHLREAIDLYKGDFLGEKYYPWAEQVREDLRDNYDDACARLAHLLEEREDIEGALQLVDRAMEHNPLSEDLCRRAMKLEAGLGRRQSVIDRFQRLKTVLARELELAPSEETCELFNSLVRLIVVAKKGT